MTIPSRPAPPPPNQQHNTGGGYNVSQQQQFKLPPPPTSKTSVKLYEQTKHNKVTTSSLSNQSSMSFSTTSSSSSESSITRKFPPARTNYSTPPKNWGNDFLDILPNNVSGIDLRKLSSDENPNFALKKVPPPRPPPPKLWLKKPGPQSVSKLSNIFGKKRNNNKSSEKQQQLPSHKYPPLKMNNDHTQIYQSRPYAFVPPLVRNSNDAELIIFDSPPHSPVLKKSTSDCLSLGSLGSNSNFSSPINGSVTQSESGFEDDFTSPPDPWESLIGGDPFKDSYNTTSQFFLNDFKTSQPVRNLNAINNIKGDDVLSNGKSLLPPPPTLTMPTIIKPKTSQTYSTKSIPLKKNPAPKPPLVFDKEEEINELYAVHEGSPPMPDCPPPPAPTQEIINNYNSSEFFDNGNDIDPYESSYGIALYNFDGAEEGDLCFKENEKVYLLQKLNDNWYYGRNRRGCEGIFPSNYIDIKIPLKQDGATANLTANNSNDLKETTNDKHQENRICKARSLYSFPGELPEDLSLNENDIISVLYRINDDWLYGEVKNRRGQFPANFVEFLSNDSL